MCGVCKSAAQPRLHWLDWRAERQVVRYATKQESFADLEAALMEQFSASLKRELERMNNGAAQAYAVAIRTGDGDAMRALEAAQRAVITERPEIAAQIAEVGREYTRLIVGAGYEQGSQGFFEISGEPSRSVIAATARASTRMADSVTRTQARLIGNAIRVGVEEDLTSREVQRLLRAGGLDADRAQAIARTETARAYTDGQIAAWNDTNGVVTGKVWLVSPFACEFCEAAAVEFGDTPIPLDQDFYPLGTQIIGASGKSLTIGFEAVSGPPLHPNCRCSIDAALEELPDEADEAMFKVTVT